MEEMNVVHTVALYGFLLALLFGAVAYKTDFCTMGAVSDWVNFGDKRRLRAWFLAMGIAMFGTQILHIQGDIDFSGVPSLMPNFSWLACAVGGFIFGVGMTLGSGCVQRSLVRLGGGNMKSLLVLLVLGLTAYATFRGLLYVIPYDYLWTVPLNLEEHGIADQSVVAVAAFLTGIENSNTLRVAITALFGFGFIAYAFKDGGFRKSFDNILAGAAIGLIIVGCWYLTGVIGNDDFEPQPVESMSFVLPVGNTLQYFMTYTGSTINFGIATVLGLISGAFLYALISRRFRFEGFASVPDMRNHILGGVLMGIGGVVGFGCTVGQGVTGMSTLSLGSALTLVAIIFGSALTMKFHFHREDKGFFSALRAALADFKLLPAPGRAEN
jgi:uncharacterized membrane protein YedE/YeeE